LPASTCWTPPTDLVNVVAISAGCAHSAALKSDGTVVCWGDNTYGQSVPPSNLSNVVSVSAGGYHTAALKSDGTIVAWGGNTYGQSTLPAGLKQVVAVSAGQYHTGALLKPENQPLIIGAGVLVPPGQGTLLRALPGCWMPGTVHWQLRATAIPGATNPWYWPKNLQVTDPRNYTFAAASASITLTPLPC
jgi:hypothetical protein